MIHKFVIKDGIGGVLGELGNPKKAKARAAKQIGCPAANLHVINLGEEAYWFDATVAQADYWLKALNVDATAVKFVGKPNC